LTHVCANAQCVVDLYINYDCDLQSTNIFARLVNVLSKKAQGRQMIDMNCSPIQLRSIRLKGLECVVSVLKCMVEWSKDLYQNPNSLQSNLGPENRPQANNENLEISKTNKLNSYDSQTSLNSSNSTSGQQNKTLNNKTSNNLIVESYNPNDFEMLKSKKELWEKGEIFSKNINNMVLITQDRYLGT